MFDKGFFEGKCFYSAETATVGNVASVVVPPVGCGSNKVFGARLSGCLQEMKSDSRSQCVGAMPC